MEEPCRRVGVEQPTADSDMAGRRVHVSKRYYGRSGSAIITGFGKTNTASALLFGTGNPL
jgi:hypothetical protein